MKKLLILILLLFVFTLTGCFKNDVVANEGQVELKIEKKYIPFMPYKEEDIPSFTFSFDGVYNTIKYVSKPYYTVFASNDDYKLSEDIANLLKSYEDRVEYVIQAQAVETLTRINSLGENGKQVAGKIQVDNQEIFDETAFINLENGLKLSIDYRRFSSDGKTYYVWRYTNNLSMYLYYPLMVIKEGTEKQVLILTLPNRVKFQVGTTLELEKVLKKDEYLEESKYTFNYLDDFTTISEKKKQIVDYYVNGYNGQMIDGKLYFDYLNVRYMVTLYDNVFTIKYVSKL